MVVVVIFVVVGIIILVVIVAVAVVIVSVIFVVKDVVAVVVVIVVVLFVVVVVVIVGRYLSYRRRPHGRLTAAVHRADQQVKMFLSWHVYSHDFRLMNDEIKSLQSRQLLCCTRCQLFYLLLLLSDIYIYIYTCCQLVAVASVIMLHLLVFVLLKSSLNW